MVGVLFDVCSGDGWGWVLEIDFAAENGKLCSVRGGSLEWRDGTVLS
jgi:hypothetical protein